MIAPFGDFQIREGLHLSAGKLSSNMTDIESVFDIEKDFLFSVLDRTDDLIGESETSTNDSQSHLLVLDRIVSLLTSVALTYSEQDLGEWESLFEAFWEVLQTLKLHLKISGEPGTPSPVSRLECQVLRTGKPSRPKFFVSADFLEDIRRLRFSLDKISRFLACCGGLFTTDLQLYGLQNMT